MQKNTVKKLISSLVDYWKSNYHKLFEKYNSALCHENYLMDEKQDLKNEIAESKKQIELLLIQNLELRSEIIVLKSIVERSRIDRSGNY